MANQEHLAILRQGVEVWNKWRKENPDIEIDLIGAQLHFRDLSHANLSKVNLSRASLTFTHLEQASLNDAILSGADLSRAELDGANLSNADLSETHLEGTSLKEAILNGANLSRANLSRIDFSENILRAANLEEVDFSDAYFLGQNLSGVNLSGADFSGAILSSDALSAEDLFNITSSSDPDEVDLSEVNLSGAILRNANFSEVNLSRVNLSGADLSGVDLSGADLTETNLCKTNLYKANLSGAIFKDTHLEGATLEEAILSEVNLSQIDLRGINLRGANLTRAILVKSNLENAILTDCLIYGISAWDLQLEGSEQKQLVITPYGQSPITVDNLEVAQFIYLLLDNQKIRQVIDTITSKVVLILGRFIPERKQVLDALREELRNHNYSPVVFDFEKPASKDLTETVSTLAHMSRFIIADLTDPSSIPYELATIVPHCVVPVLPLLVDDEKRQEFAMFKDLTRRYQWVLPIYRYTDQDMLLASLKEKVIFPAEEKARELER